MKNNRATKMTVNNFIENLKSMTPTIEVPEWDMSFYIKLFTADFALKVQSMAKDENGNIINETDNNLNILYSILIYSLVDEDGNELFDLDQIIKLTNNQLLVVQNLFYKILELNGMTKESMEKIQSDFLAQQKGSLLTS